MPQQVRLVFFESFKYTKIEERIETIRFRFPVRLHRARILPFQQEVEGVQVRYCKGATTPSAFELELFGRAYNVRKSVFEQLALPFEYSESKAKTDFPLNDQVLTDHVAIKGRFSGLTLLLYGEIFNRNGGEWFDNLNLKEPRKAKRLKVEKPGAAASEQMETTMGDAEVDADDDDDEDDDLLFALLGADEAPEPARERLCIQAMEPAFPRHIVTLTAPYMRPMRPFPIRLEPAESADHLQKQIEDKVKALAQELVYYCEHTWRHSLAAQQAQSKLRSSKNPRVSPARARELLQTLQQCLEAATPYVPRGNTQGQPGLYGSHMVTSHTPSNIITADVVASEIPLMESLFALLAARKERRSLDKSKDQSKPKVRLRSACPPSIMEEVLKFLLKAMEFEPCADKFVGQRPLTALPFAEGIKAPQKGVDVIAELLAASELNFSEDIESYCGSLLCLAKCHSHLYKLQDYAKAWNTFSRQPDFTASTVDYFELSQQTHEAIVAIHQCLEEEGCLQPTLDPSVPALVALNTMAGGELLTPLASCRPCGSLKAGSRPGGSPSLAPPYHFLRIARSLSLVPSLCDVILSYCALGEAFYRQRADQPAIEQLSKVEPAEPATPAPAVTPPNESVNEPPGQPPPDSAEIPSGEMDVDRPCDYDDVMGTDLLEYVAEIAQAAARLMVQLMACSQGLVLLSLHPSVLSRLMSCLLPRFGPDSRDYGGLPYVSAMKALRALADERSGCDAYLHLITNLLPCHIQALLCVDSLLSPEEYDSDLLPLLHKLSYDSPASAAALTQVLASNEGMGAFLSALERVSPTSTNAKFLVHIMLNCLRSEEGPCLATLFCKRLSETTIALMRAVDAAASNEPRRPTTAIDRHIDLKEMLRDIRAWAEPNRVLIDLGIEDFLRYIQAQVLDFNTLVVTQTQSNPLTMMIVTRLVSAMAIFCSAAKQSTLVCMTTLDQFGVTTDRQTNMPALMEEMLNIVLRTALKPRMPLSKNRKAYEVYDACKMDDRFLALLGPVLGLLETLFVTLHKANDHNKMWHNIPPTAYRNSNLLETLLKVYVALAYKVEYTRDYENLDLLQSIIMHWFWLPHKERARPPVNDHTAPVHSFHLAFIGPNITDTLNDSHDTIMKMVKESPRNHYALLFMLCRLLFDIEKSALQRCRHGDNHSDASSVQSAASAGSEKAKDAVNPENPVTANGADHRSIDSISASSVSAMSQASLDWKGKNGEAETPAKKKRRISGSRDNSSSSGASDSAGSEWSDSEENGAPGQRRPTCLLYSRSEEQLYHNLGNVIVDAIGYSLNAGLAEMTATYILRMAQCTAPLKELDEGYPERAKLHLSIRQELEEHRKTPFGQKLLELVDSKAATVTPSCYFAASAADNGAEVGDMKAVDLRELLHPSILDDFMMDVKACEELGVTLDQPNAPQQREGDEDPNHLQGKSWEKMGAKSSGSNRPGFDHFRDSFRDRKPNTSRPPSAHVDDFGTVPLTMAQHTLDGVSAVSGFSSFEVKSKEKDILKDEASAVSTPSPLEDTAALLISPTSTTTRTSQPAPHHGSGSAFDPILPHAPAVLLSASPGIRDPAPSAQTGTEGLLPRPGTPPLQFGAIPGLEERRREELNSERRTTNWEESRSQGILPDRQAEKADRWNRTTIRLPDLQRNDSTQR